MDVVEWQDAPRPNDDALRSPAILSPALVGVLGTFLLHALLLPSIYVGTRGLRGPPPGILDAPRPSSSFAENLVLISIGSGGTDHGLIENTTSTLATLSKMKVRPVIDKESPPILDVESLTLGEDQAPTTISDEGRIAQKAHLLGIYTGQIQARIDRIWRRPRSPVNETDAVAEDSFRCEAQIIQASNGAVQEILVPRCNGSPAWQRSLVLAIQQASPLPAPPDPSVFSQSVILNFLGLPFRPGASEDDYEMATSGPASGVALARSQERISR